MWLDAIRTFVSRRPAWVMTTWLGVAAGIGCFSPNLTRLAAEAQASMLPADAESLRAAELVKQSWPDQAYDAMAVAVLHRPGGLTEADRQYASGSRSDFRVLADPVEIVGRTRSGFASRRSPQRLVSDDKTVSLVAVTLSSSFVAPASHERGRLDGTPGEATRICRLRRASRSAGRATR